jgi:soluble lytic murein transglycosylase-like protein
MTIRGIRTMVRPALSVLALLGAVTLHSPAVADVALLRSGASLEISRFTAQDGWIVLHLDGGGEIALPQSQVVEIRRQPRSHKAEAPSGTSIAPTADSSAVPLPPTGSAPPAGLDDPTPTDRSFAAESVASPDRASLIDLASRIARHHAVDEDLVLAVIEVESRYDARAISPRGATGLMQLMPKTASRLEVRDPYDPADNVDGGVRYLKELLERYSGQVRLALAAYNAGEEAVERFRGIPPYRETIQYVDRVMREMKR